MVQTISNKYFKVSLEKKCFPVFHVILIISNLGGQTKLSNIICYTYVISVGAREVYAWQETDKTYILFASKKVPTFDWIGSFFISICF